MKSDIAARIVVARRLLTVFDGQGQASCGIDDFVVGSQEVVEKDWKAGKGSQNSRLRQERERED